MITTKTEVRLPTTSPALTRRTFLEQLGAIGGSSLVMTTLSSWDLMAESAGQRPVLAGRPAKAKVLILGAGTSGLVLGYELGKLGYDYHVLEARDRVGKAYMQMDEIDRNAGRSPDQTSSAQQNCGPSNC